MTLQNAMAISSEGMTLQSDRLKVSANNIANIDTPNYVRKIPVIIENNSVSFEEVLSQMRNGVIQTGIAFSPNGATFAGVVADPTPGKRVYRPNHPDADKDGYITMSNVNPLTDIADATVAARVYEANLAVIGITKAMASRAVDIGRGQ